MSLEMKPIQTSPIKRLLLGLFISFSVFVLLLVAVAIFAFGFDPLGPLKRWQFSSGRDAFLETGNTGQLEFYFVLKPQENPLEAVKTCLLLFGSEGVSEEQYSRCSAFETKPALELIQNKTRPCFVAQARLVAYQSLEVKNMDVQVGKPPRGVC
jgi:hypothetical protein